MENFHFIDDQGMPWWSDKQLSDLELAEKASKEAKLLEAQERWIYNSAWEGCNMELNPLGW